MKIASEQEMLAFGEQFANLTQTGEIITATCPTKNNCETMVTTCSAEHKDLARAAWELLSEGHAVTIALPMVIELIGDVGAGKTTFVRGFAKGLGIKQKITSPSFTISKSYALPDGRTLTHYDFYRLSDPGLMANDLQEKIHDHHIIIIEWGNSVKNLLPENRIVITISKNDDGSREIDIKNNINTATNPSKTTAKTNHQNPVKPNTKNTPKKDVLSLYLDTSTPTTILKLNDREYIWESGHDLAEKLLQFIHDKLEENHKDWHDITEITFMSGPGSFTGLRIGAAVVNTLASELNIPLYTHKGEQVKIVLPDYGRNANIGKPRK